MIEPKDRQQAVIAMTYPQMLTLLAFLSGYAPEVFDRCLEYIKITGISPFSG